MRNYLMLFCIFFLTISCKQEMVLVEAEAFDDYGGWALDAQFMDQMGSPFLMAHGLGEPVGDACTEVEFPTVGDYKVFVRTRDWAGPNGPGQFKLLLDDIPLAKTFGNGGEGKWFWQEGGTIRVDSCKVKLTLRDETGFNGRCDALLFIPLSESFTPSDDLLAIRKLRSSINRQNAKIRDEGRFDLVVVGGGFAGICASVASARLGLKVALIQNRGVLGGAASSEIRVNPIGGVGSTPYPHNRDIVKELLYPSEQRSYSEDLVDMDKKRLEVVAREKNITLYLDTHINGVEMKNGQIEAVTGENVRSGLKYRFEAPLFVDCTGDANVGYLAGAEYRIGREGKSMYNEPFAPVNEDTLLMGNSLYWYAKETGIPSSFPACPWALPIDSEEHYEVSEPKWPMKKIPGITATSSWNWESGFNEDNIANAECIRDYNLKAIFGTWDYLKNRSPEKEKYQNSHLAFAAYVLGKRESRRLLGDVILTQNDIINRVSYPDSCVAITWYFDIHYPHPQNSRFFPGKEFRSVAYDDPNWESLRNGQPGYYFPFKPYFMPFRCLYSKNVPNLMMAGRNISVSHIALAPSRVMITTGEMGTVVGRAAYLLKKYKTIPSMIYEKYLDEFKEVLLNPDKFEREVGDH